MINFTNVKSFRIMNKYILNNIFSNIFNINLNYYYIIITEYNFKNILITKFYYKKINYILKYETVFALDLIFFLYRKIQIQHKNLKWINSIKLSKKLYVKSTNIKNKLRNY